MPKTKISEYSATANSNTDVASINIDEGCAPSGINNAIRAVMGHLKDFQSGTSNDPFTVGSSGSLTLSYGTANGVAYLNGSKVLTTGSALVFDGTNLGLGVTPSAAGVNYKTFQLYDLTSTNIAASSYGSNFVTNAYLNSGTWTRGGNTYAPAKYNQFNGAHIWSTAAAAGTTISWTDAMTLDASGNLGVGATSPGTRLQVTGANTTFDTACFGQMLVQSTTAYNSTPRAGIAFSVKYTAGGSYTAGGCTIQSFKENSTDGDFGTGLLFTTQGNAVAPSEKMRIDSSGFLLVGTTSSTAYVNGFSVRDPSTATNASIGHVNGSGSGSGYVLFGYNNVGIGSITQNGTTAVAYNTSSDYRLKHDIAPMTGALAKVATLKPCTYKWNADNSDGEGFIAHELAEVCPHAVTGAKDAVDDEGNPQYQGIDTSFLVATLTAAIQEQQAIIQSLTARITTLEGASA